MKEFIELFTENILLELFGIMLSVILNSCFCSKPKDVKIETYNVTIYADKGWQITPVLVEEQTEVILAADGSWSMTNDKRSFNALGLVSNPSSWGEYRLDERFNHGQLLCKVNDDSSEQIFTIGQSMITDKGSIYCRINDKAISNNEGKLYLQLIIKKKLEKSEED